MSTYGVKEAIGTSLSLSKKQICPYNITIKDCLQEGLKASYGMSSELSP